MSTGTPAPEDRDDLSHDELMSALFANMVVQQTNMALVFLGNVPHPETGQSIQDLDAARMFIDQLEMLAFKTRGNLGKDEDQLLQEGLMTLRMAFVEAVEKRPNETAARSDPPTAPTPESSSSGSDTPPSSDASRPIVSGDPDGEESRKRFTKKY